MKLVTLSRELPRDRTLERALHDLVESASVEVTPRQIAAAGPPSSILPLGTRVYVPFLPKADYRHTVEACRLLMAGGMQPIPHLPARAVSSRSQLADWLKGLAETKVDSLLLIAGDLKRPAGPYENTLAVLDSGLLVDHGFRRLGIAGYPEGHPVAAQKELDHALHVKMHYAASTETEMWIVTQFAFSSDPVIAWLNRRRDMGCTLPVNIGMPGPAKLKTLIGYAAQCGVGVSARILKRRPSAARLLGPWSPVRLLRDLAYHCIGEPQTLLSGIHLFPFGGIGRTAGWLRDLSEYLGGKADDTDDKTSATGRIPGYF